jgi:mRNA-degrading endonuclease RelE of RelBE toxin-antitoxin system
VQLYQAISTLSEPINKWRNVKKLSNHSFNYRLRVGNYRVIFDFEKRAKIASIEKIGVRNERTY